jgi:phosphotransferase system enzyme I (PtsI)
VNHIDTRDLTTQPDLIHGVGIGRATTVGLVLRMPEPIPDPADRPSELTPVAEASRASDALSATAAQLRHRGAAAGGTAAEVLDALAMMAEDPALAADVRHRIEDGATAEYAIHAAMTTFREMLASMGGYLGERAGDLDDVALRAIAHLQGLPNPGVPESVTPFVLVARDLAPADTATLDLDLVLALVTTGGGPTSHTAILARERGITAVVGATGAASLVDGDVVLVDAENGTVERNPAQERVDLALQRTATLEAIRAQSAGPGRLASGQAVPLLANIGSIDSAREAVARGAEGVGLFRTEVLFLGAEKAPSVHDQAAAYREVFAQFPGQKVVVRVLDAGADKPLAFLTDSSEENPALGRRGLRALAAHEHVLRDQLTALAIAAANSDALVQVMAPMVSIPSEARYFRDLAH